jgi:opacity protein-like surface antigen
MTLSTNGRTAGVLGIVLAFAVVTATPAFAQGSGATGLGIRGIGVRLGLTDPEDASGAFMYGVHLDAGTIVPNVHLIPSLEFWSVGTDVGTYSADYSDMAIKLDANVDFPLQDQRLVPYLGGGLGLHRLKFESNAPMTVDATSTKIGFSILGGMKNEFTPNLSLFGEVGYTFVENANQLRLLGGFTYKFIY